MGWLLGVLTTSPRQHSPPLARRCRRQATRVVADSADVLGSRFDLQRPPDVVVRDTAKGLRIQVAIAAEFEYLYGHLPRVGFHHRALLTCYKFCPGAPARSSVASSSPICPGLRAVREPGADELRQRGGAVFPD